MLYTIAVVLVILWLLGLVSGYTLGAVVHVLVVIAVVLFQAGLLSGRRVVWIGAVLAIASPVRADIGVIVAEPVSALGFFTRVGHVGTYLSNICPDGSPIKVRACLPGESGAVVIRSSTLSEHEDYDWAIVPFEEYLHGFASRDLAPLIGTRKLQRVIEGHDFHAVFSRAMATTDGAAPDGQW